MCQATMVNRLRATGCKDDVKTINAHVESGRYIVRSLLKNGAFTAMQVAFENADSDTTDALIPSFSTMYGHGRHSGVRVGGVDVEL